MIQYRPVSACWTASKLRIPCVRAGSKRLDGRCRIFTTHGFLRHLSKHHEWIIASEMMRTLDWFHVSYRES